jgi:ABC-type transport system substrate-binding protein
VQRLEREILKLVAHVLHTHATRKRGIDIHGFLRDAAALEIEQKELGAAHPSLATTLSNLAELHRAEGRAQRISGLTAPNDSTVVVTLAEPFAIFPKLLAMPVASIVTESITAHFGERPVGTGPWRLGRWQRGDG